MDSILLFNDHGRYTEKWLYASRGTLLAAMTGVSFDAAKAHANILALVDRILQEQSGKPAEIVELVTDTLILDNMKHLAEFHIARGIAPETFLLGFKLMKTCTLDMIMESPLEGRERLAGESAKVFEAMEHVLTGLYHKLVITGLQEKLLTRLEQASAPKREIHLIRSHDKDRPLRELTQAEYAVCSLILEGCATKELADRLHIAESTVHTHRKRIRAKLGVPTGTNLFVYLKRHDF